MIKLRTFGSTMINRDGNRARQRYRIRCRLWKLSDMAKRLAIENFLDDNIAMAVYFREKSKRFWRIGIDSLIEEFKPEAKKLEADPEY